MNLTPVSQRDAKAFCAMWHRSHTAPRGMKFAVGAAANGILVAIAIAGRPVARRYDDGHTLEVTRVASDGTPNACSMLYGACARAAFALGYTRLITYTRSRVYGPVCNRPCAHLSCEWIRSGETGTSLLAAGWHVIAERKPRPGWNMPSRPRTLKGVDNFPRSLWEAV